MNNCSGIQLLAAATWVRDLSAMSFVLKEALEVVLYSRTCSQIGNLDPVVGLTVCFHVVLLGVWQ